MTLGLDIGTTTLSAAAVDCASGTLCKSWNIPSESALPSPHSWERTQCIETIRSRMLELLRQAKADFPDIRGIGLTGQMHGVLYVDDQGRPVSPLYTWQDGRGNLPYREGVTYCQHLQQFTAAQTATGFGAVTHFWLQENRQLPAGAVCLCTAADYLGMALTGRTRPLLHRSNAASLGFFDLARGDFDREALEKAGMDPGFFPETTGDILPLGSWEGIPVTLAVGDNQASFLGSVDSPEDSLLVNIGTGSQIAMRTRRWETHDPRLEVRPYLGDSYLLTASALCGGYAYGLVERFFRQLLKEAGCPETSAYPLLNRLAEKGFAQEQLPTLDPRFLGERRDPGRTGAFTGLTPDTFTPEGLAASAVLGILSELWESYQAMLREGNPPAKQLVASGNGVRKNPVMPMALERVFGLAPKFPKQEEEAAFGAARLPEKLTQSL